MVGTKEQYLERVKKYRPKAFVGGERIGNVLTDPNTRPIVNTVAKTYELAGDPRFEEIMTAESPWTGNRIAGLNTVSREVLKILRSVSNLPG